MGRSDMTSHPAVDMVMVSHYDVMQAICCCFFESLTDYFKHPAIMFNYQRNLYSTKTWRSFMHFFEKFKIFETTNTKRTSHMKTTPNMKTTSNMKTCSNMKMPINMRTTSNMKTTSNIEMTWIMNLISKMKTTWITKLQIQTQICRWLRIWRRPQIWGQPQLEQPNQIYQTKHTKLNITCQTKPTISTKAKHQN